MAKPLEEWMTVQEIAAAKGVAENSVRVAIKTGRLPSVKKGRTYLVRRQFVDAWQVSDRGPRKGEKG